MSRAYRIALLVVVTLAGLAPTAACSSESSSAALAPDDASAAVGNEGGPPTSSEPIAASQYCETIVEPFCEFYLRCGRIVASSAEECRSVFLETCNARYEPRDVDLEAAGLLSLSSSGVETCAAHLRAVSCEEQTNDLDGACGGMWLGRSPQGAPCAIDVESFVCEPGTTCILGLDFCGKCEPAVALGETCGNGIRCAPAASCVSGKCVARSLPGSPCDAQQPCTTGARCESGKCVAPTTVGEGDACDSDRRCAYRSACEGGRCVRTSLLGGACTTDRGCASGRCIESTCTKLAATGEACTSSAQCSSAMCTKGKCTALPSACFSR